MSLRGILYVMNFSRQCHEGSIAYGIISFWTMSWRGILYVMNSHWSFSLLCEQPGWALRINWTDKTCRVLRFSDGEITFGNSARNCLQPSWAPNKMSKGFRGSRKGRNCGKFPGRAQTNLPFRINPLLFWIWTILPSLKLVQRLGPLNSKG